MTVLAVDRDPVALTLPETLRWRSWVVSSVWACPCDWWR